MTGTLLAEIEAWAARTPDAEALVDARGRMSYAELAAAAWRWAAALGSAGVGSGDRVMMLAPPGRESLVCLLATGAIGAIWSGLDPRLRANEIASRIDDLRPALLLTFARLGRRAFAPDLLAAVAAHGREVPLVLIAEDDRPLPASEPGVVTLDRFLAAAGTVSKLAPDAVVPALVVYTSGSSGIAKGAMLTAEAMIDFGRRQDALWPVEPMRTLNFLPISHAGAIVDLTVPTLIAGGCVIFQRKFDALESLRMIARERVTFWASVPSTFLLQVALPEFADTDFGSVQLIAIEGAPIPPELAERLLSIAPIATNYGMTETCSAIAAMAPTRSVADLTHSVGLAFGDAEIRIDAPPGEVTGEILVRSPRNLSGYWNQAEATRDAYTTDGFFHTGDIGELLSDGRLRLRGRKREMFKSGGYNVYPAEVERVLGEHADVADVAVVSVADPVWQEVGVAFVVAEGAAERAALGERLNAWCKDRMADYKRPKRFIVLDELPLLPIGKVDRQSLARSANDPR